MTHDITKLSIDTIRTLSMDAVQKANSGHPGAPMALAPVAYTLWQNFLKYDPQDPTWFNRDRFVLSNGHASMLLYSLLHLNDVKAVSPQGKVLEKPAVSMEDIQNFRQLDSKCAGHPEYGYTSGVETTTGPLGQGIANSVGMALAMHQLAARYNKPQFQLFDYNVYALCGDGCLMEGVGTEAASYAGHLKLSNLCWIYDSNRITIEGSTDLTFTEDVKMHFQSYGWNVLHAKDANDLSGLQTSFQTFLQTQDKPTLIIVNSHIGYGAPNKQDKASAHGEPLGAEEVKAAKRFYGWPEEAQFLVPDGVKENFYNSLGQKGKVSHQNWQSLFERYQEKYPELAKEILQMQAGELPAHFEQKLPNFSSDAKGKATRETSHVVLNALASHVPWLNGGSADLAPSTKTLLTMPEAGSLSAKNLSGRNMHYGLREHAMGAIANGLALCKMRTYAATFLTFSDYMRPAIRLSALMEVPVIYIFTHDSIGLGEDGPTHQPVEHLVSLRAIPGLLVMRPADANEVVECWHITMQQKKEPVALILTRQAVPTFDRTRYASAEGVQKGAYVLADCSLKDPQVILIGTGSEVQLCLEAFEELTTRGIQARVVSMPCWELFDRQTQSYQDSVLPPHVKARVAVEQGSDLGWGRYVGEKGRVIAMHTFGKSAPLQQLRTFFGFTPQKVLDAALEQLNN